MSHQGQEVNALLPPLRLSIGIYSSSLSDNVRTNITKAQVGFRRNKAGLWRLETIRWILHEHVHTK